MAPNFEELVELLIDGARYDDLEDVQSALDQGVNINAQDERGSTGGQIIFMDLCPYIVSWYSARAQSRTRTTSFL
jgi:hypothetical protein